ncbi:MAG: MoaD/ThiS family protein [Rudaea sp.]
MRILIPALLRSYTGNRAEVQAEGETLAEVMRDLDRQYPGIAFRIVNEQQRIREHILVFVNHARSSGMEMRLEPGDEIRIVPAISGG